MKESSRDPLWSLLAAISRLHIVVIAALGTLTFGWIFFAERPWVLALICGLDWFIVNLLNRVVDIEEDRSNKIVGTGFVEAHQGAVQVVGFGVLIISLAVTTWFLPRLTPLRLAYHFLGLIYNWRLLPGKRRLKDMYALKNSASALGFIITVFGYPMAVNWHLPWSQGNTNVGVIAAAVFFFLFELSYEIIYDLRDMEGDRQQGVRSFPVVHGEQGAIKLIDALLVISTGVLLLAYSLALVPWRLLIMGVAPVLQGVLYKLFMRKGIQAWHCIALTWLGAALLATYHLWVWLELPGAYA